MSSSFLQRGVAAYMIVGGMAFVAAAPAWSQLAPTALPSTSLPSAARPKGVVQGPSVEGITEYP